MLTFAGSVGVSLVDYPGEVCSTIFTQGCNIDCAYCHNSAMKERRKLVCEDSQEECFFEEYIIMSVQKYAKVNQNLTITGGEPTIHGNHLIHFLKKIKENVPEIHIKLDTNGTIYPIVEKAIPYIDYLAVDFKGNYFPYTVGQEANLIKTLNLLKRKEVKGEMRITMYPPYTGRTRIDFAATHYVMSLYGTSLPDKIFLQQYRPVVGTEHIEPLKKGALEEYADMLRRRGSIVSLRGV